MKIAFFDNIPREIIRKEIPGFQEVTLKDNPNAIFVRSTKLHKELAVSGFSDSLYAICRPGAETSNIPVEECTRRGIAVFNTPGANAISVAEKTAAMLIMAAGRIVPALLWSEKQRGEEIEYEGPKQAFVGREISGKTILIIGFGNVGKRVAAICRAFKMRVLAYDPYLPESNFAEAGVIRVASLNDPAISECDFISLHPSPQTARNLINAAFLSRVKKGVIILNTAREEVINTPAMINALTDEHVGYYFSDFFNPTIGRAVSPEKFAQMPHVGGNTKESIERAVVMAARELRDFWRTGTVRNSVNFPEVEMLPPRNLRVLICDDNRVGRLAGITAKIAQSRYNITNVIDPPEDQPKENLAYRALNLDGPRENLETLLKALKEVEGVLKVRAITP